MLDTFRLIAPEFSSVSDADVQKYINLVSPQVSACEFGADYNLAVAYLAADTLATAVKQKLSSVGIASDKKAGDLEITYAMPANLDYYSFSIYGEMFKRLRDKHILGVIIANSRVVCPNPIPN
jgi:hypothetical protein